MPCTPPRTRWSRARTGWSGSARASGPSGPGRAYASEHSEASPAKARAGFLAPGFLAAGFLAERVRRLKAMRGRPQAATKAERGHARPQPGDWRDGLLRPILAIACAVFAVGVVMALPPTRDAMLSIASSVGLTSSSGSSSGGSGGATTDASGNPISASAGGPSQAGTSAARAGTTATACPPSASPSPSNQSRKSVTPTVPPATR